MSRNDIEWIWSPEWQVLSERVIWRQVLQFQMKNGALPVDDGAITAYALTSSVVNMHSIRERELVTRHDVKARIEEFNALASAKLGRFIELIHAGMTSADIVDNIALIRMKDSLGVWLRDRDVPRIAREHLAYISENLPFRGIKGAVGTQQDQLDLLGSQELCDQLDEELAMNFGFSDLVMQNVGQVYPRSLDLQVASGVMTAIYSMGEVPFAWRVLCRGYLNMVAEYSGSQWNEGDVTTSSIRRVALPGFFQSADLALRGVEPT